MWHPHSGGLIWVIPALTYLVFYVKFISDYWKNAGTYGKRGHILFTILWFFYDLRAVSG